MYRDVVTSVNKRYVSISERMTKAYEKKFGLKCELYFPIRPRYNKHTKYRDMKIFAPHQSYSYSERPDDITQFYIPRLIKKEAMNSSELEFDAFYTDTEAPDRPFIETSKKRELPIGTKVVVFLGESRMKFVIDKKLVVTGADGFMLLRMYLDPLAKDSDDDNEAEEQKESATKKQEDKKCECNSEKKCSKETKNPPVEASEEAKELSLPSQDELEMHIPEEDE